MLVFSGTLQHSPMKTGKSTPRVNMIHCPRLMSYFSTKSLMDDCMVLAQFRLPWKRQPKLSKTPVSRFQRTEEIFSQAPQGLPTRITVGTECGGWRPIAPSPKDSASSKEFLRLEKKLERLYRIPRFQKGLSGPTILTN